MEEFSNIKQLTCGNVLFILLGNSWLATTSIRSFYDTRMKEDPRSNCFFSFQLNIIFFLVHFKIHFDLKIWLNFQTFLKIYHLFKIECLFRMTPISNNYVLISNIKNHTQFLRYLNSRLILILWDKSNTKIILRNIINVGWFPTFRILLRLKVPAVWSSSLYFKQKLLRGLPRSACSYYRLQ